MSSVNPVPSDSSPLDDERTGRAKILHAAIACFAEHGVKATSLKTIAEAAGVSPPLVVHHFRSKAGLRTACDEYVAATIREGKQAAMGQGPQLDPLASLRSYQDGPPILRYLARTLGDGSPEVVALIDEMVDDAVAYMDEGVRNGFLKPTAYPRPRAIVLTMWSLGALALHEHLERLLGVDITGDMETMREYMLPAGEIMATGVLAEGLFERLKEALADEKEDAS